MRMRDLQRLFKYWGRVPPQHELLALERGVDIGPERMAAAPARAMSDEQMKSFLAAAGAVHG